LAFADSLCRSGDYFRAVGEYKRVFLLAPPGSELGARARLHQAACTAKAGEFTEAAKMLSALARQDTPVAEPALFELALVSCLGGDPKEGAAAFERYRSRYPTSPRSEQAALLAGLCWLRAGEGGTAASVLAPLAATSPCASELLEAARHPALPERSPLLAGVLSAALPGAGQLYCGRLGMAAASFTFTGLSAFGSYAAWKNGYTGAGILASFVALTAWVGSVRSAATCAAQRNRQERAGWLSGLARRCNLSLVPGQVAFSY